MHFNETFLGQQFITPVPEEAQVLVIVSMSICGSLSLIGNFLVIYVMLTDKKLKEMSASAYITAIAAVDFMTTLYTTPFGIYQV